MFEKIKELFSGKKIQNEDDLREVFNKAGMPDVKIFVVPAEPELKIYDPLEKLKIQMDCKKKK
jgi:hypothetical protein